MSLTRDDKNALTLVRAYALDKKTRSVNVRYYSTSSWAGVRLPEVESNTIYLDGSHGTCLRDIPWAFYAHLKKYHRATKAHPNCYLIGTTQNLVDIVDEMFRLDMVAKLKALVD